jgi:hypothetical protein
MAAITQGGCKVLGTSLVCDAGLPGLIGVATDILPVLSGVKNSVFGHVIEDDSMRFGDETL